MVDPVRDAARAVPERVAVMTPQDERVTFAELDALVDEVARGLHARGVAPGTRVAARLPNGLPLVALVHACRRVGAVLVSLHPRVPDKDVAWLAMRAGAKVVVQREEHVPIEDEGAPVTSVALPDAAPQAVVLTSGSTGDAKAAVLTRGNFDALARASRERLGHRADDAWLLTLPTGHVGGLSVLHRAARDAVAVVLHAKFDAARVNDAIDAGDVTCVSVVPTMLRRLLDERADRAFPRTLRVVLVGGAAAPPALVERAHAARAPVAVTYGLTEACSQVATTPPGRAHEKPGSAGPPLPGVRVRVAEDGEILVSGPTVFAGYDHASSPVRDGWLATGDLGHVDEDGWLWVAGRKDDLIVTGGENVAPAEVERVLTAHPAVADAVVAGVPDAEWGARVGAVVEVAPGARLTAEELDAHARERLPAFKVPREWMLVDALPRTGSGKVARKEAAGLLTRG